MIDSLKLHEIISSCIGNVDFWSLRRVRSTQNRLVNRHGVIKAPHMSVNDGYMITVVSDGGLGYAASSDMSRLGVTQCAERAQQWALLSAKHSIINFSETSVHHSEGSYTSDVKHSWDDMPTIDKLTLLGDATSRLKRDRRIIDSEAYLWQVGMETDYVTDQKSHIHQTIHWINPGLRVVAHDNGETERRSFGGHGICRQGGLEVLDLVGFMQAAEQIPEEAIALTHAPSCPDECLDLVLAPDQMILQIHESIGHPLELDRILGDERNYAGRSFVSKDMFGTYQYGSDLLNITFDPSKKSELASYAYDDEGLKAEKVYLIKDGKLLAGLGGHVSQERLGVEGVANSRAVDWNRPAIDRMANLNLEPGDSSLDEMIASVDRGIYMKTNQSWSIDDSRNKFQFGCEWGQMIEGGKLTHLVRKPNYRGVSSAFWHSLSGVGNKDTMDILGTPFCGKGEPNQAIFVGHASPACLFRNIQAFGGE